MEILEFNDNLAPHFRDLNLAWIKKYFTVEPMDDEMLSNPKKYVIDKGGYIFFAKVDNEIAGTFALLKMTDKVYKLTKMAVDEKFQRQKIGANLLEFCIQHGRNLGADKIILFSNTVLGPAIHLYRKHGFQEIPLSDVEYDRSNIKMEKVL